MSTRGLIGFVLDGTEKLTYNHFDSYPSGLGSATVSFVQACDLAELTTQVRACLLVNADDVPTPDQASQLGMEDVEEAWYDLLNDDQGNLAAMLARGAMIDSADFASDSLFCEWAYVIDLDAGNLDFYKGFQESAHTDGRFADRVVRPGHRIDTYYPVRRLLSVPLTRVQELGSLMESLIERLEPDEDAGESTSDIQAYADALGTLGAESPVR